MAEIKADYRKMFDKIKEGIKTNAKAQNMRKHMRMTAIKMSKK